MFKCGFCEKSFSRSDNKKRHENVHSGDKSKTECFVCGLYLSRADYLQTHLFSAHGIKRGEKTADASVAADLSQNNNMKRTIDVNDADDDGGETSGVNKRRRADNARLCEVCGIVVPPVSFSSHLRSTAHKENSFVSLSANIQTCRSAFKNRIVSYRINNTDFSALNIDSFFESNRTAIAELVKIQLEKFITVKINFELFAHYFIVKKEDIASELKSFNTKNVIFNSGTDVDATLTDFKTKLEKKAEEFKERDSGWSLQKISHLEMNVMKYNPLRASSYIDLPSKLKTKKALVNVKNNDNACFAWAVVSALYPVEKNSERVSSYPHYSTVLNFENLEFPMQVKDIRKFEKQNEFVSVNVFGVDERCNVVGPLYCTERKKQNHVNLLYLSDDTLHNNHYVLISNLSRLVSSQINNQSHKKFICDCCLVYFSTEASLQRHCEHDCGKMAVKLPTAELKKDRLGRESPGNLIKFKNYERKEMLPFAIYADSESLLKPIHTVEPSADESFTVPVKQHVPYSFAYKIKCSYDDSLSEYRSFVGRDCAAHFIASLVSDAKQIGQIINTVVPVRALTFEERARIYAQTVCHICEQKFSDVDRANNALVLDHDHLTGEPRGLAHSICNLNYKIPNFIPVFFHNLSNYDSHLFIKQLASVCDDLTVIPINKEKYISFSAKIPIGDDDGDDGDEKTKRKIEIRFLDSIRFINSSLAALAKNLKPDDFVELRNHFPDQAQFSQVTEKGIFPYEYLTDFQVLNETELPPKSAFYNEFRDENITDEEYERAKRVWATFDCTTLLDYSNNYLKTDVLLLCDIFEKFRKVELATYNLDPAHYYTLPGFSWDAMLKYTNVELELMSDIDMIHFVRKSLRGGISQCVKRHCVANNKHMSGQFNPNVPSSYIVYLDANNQYGWAMSQPLPTGEFRWLDEEEIKNFDVTSVPDKDGDAGYFVEVDLDYPARLHDRHNDMPFCAEKLVPPRSKFGQPKLLTTLNDKRRYTLHYRYLKQCLDNGLILKKVHRVLKFAQSSFLKTYIDRNTELRAAAVSDFEKDLYKLKNNAIYGKSIESVEKRVDVRLVTHWECVSKKRGAEALIAQPNFHSITVFNEDLSAVQMKRLSIEYNKPNYIGAAVLDLSKLLMYDFFYGYLKSKFDVNLLYTDTDSFVLEVLTDDLYEEIKTDLNLFDTSNFPQDNVYGLPSVNKKVLGKFKFETGAKLITEFVGLRSKMYCFRLFGDDEKCHKRAKGIQSNVVDKFTFADYLNCLQTGEKMMCQMCVFRSVKHDVQIQKINKVGLSAADDKRFLVPNAHETLSWGHRDIPDDDRNLNY